MALDVSLFLLGLNSDARSAGSTPAWLPAWADSGVDFTQGQAYFDGALITDLSTILGASTQAPFGGVFDPTAVTSSGMAVFAANSNRPAVKGGFLTRISSLNFTFLIHLDLTTASNAIDFMIFTDANGTGGGLVVETGGGVSNLNVTDFNNGNFETVGQMTTNSENKICGANTASGWLSSLNGATAVLDAYHSVETITQGTLGQEHPENGGSFIMEGYIRSIFFGPVTSVAADIEARSTL